jgi:hypothetical protein
MLPLRSEWKRVEAGAETASAWWSLEHGASGARLDVKRWRATRSVRVDDCEHDLGLSRPEVVDQAAIVEHVPVEVSDGAALRVAGVFRSSPGELSGFSVLIWATPRSCAAAYLSTRATGQNAEASVAEQLSLFARSLETLNELGVEDRARAQ